MRTSLPNFFLAGAPKAGSTSLYRYLSQQPAIFMSAVKEPCFFASEVRPENFAEPEFRRPTPGLITDWPSYQALFQHAGDAAAVGEASVCYLWSPGAPANIAVAIPHARILLVLRDPADRASSQYVQGVAKGRIHCGLGDHIRASLREHDGLFRITYPFLQMGDYAGQIRRYQAHFPSAQIHIALYEDFQRSPAEFLRGIFEFLGVYAGFVPATSQGDHVYGKRTSLAMSPENRRFLVDYYRAGILDLQAMLGRDLSAWLA